MITRMIQIDNQLIKRHLFQKLLKNVVGALLTTNALPDIASASKQIKCVQVAPTLNVIIIINIKKKDYKKSQGSNKENLQPSWKRTIKDETRKIKRDLMLKKYWLATAKNWREDVTICIVHAGEMEKSVLPIVGATYKNVGTHTAVTLIWIRTRQMSQVFQNTDLITS